MSPVAVRHKTGKLASSNSITFIRYKKSLILDICVRASTPSDVMSEKYIPILLPNLPKSRNCISIIGYNVDVADSIVDNGVLSTAITSGPRNAGVIIPWRYFWFSKGIVFSGLTEACQITRVPINVPLILGLNAPVSSRSY